jgi:hypothetical protein
MDARSYVAPVGRLTGDRITSSEIGHLKAAGVVGEAAITSGSSGGIRRLGCCPATTASMKRVARDADC